MPDKEKIYSLDSLGLLDDTRHEDLDNLADLARKAVGASNVLITIVRPTYDRQYVISHSGVTPIQPEHRKLPLSCSVCKHVRAIDAPVAFEDAQNAPELEDNPAFEGYAIGSYLGVPIHRSEGSAIGAISCIEHHPRTWTDWEVETLLQCARGVDSYIRMLKLNLEQKRANDELRQIAEARGSFLTHMSHELRTPLTGVVGASKLLMSLGLEGRAGELAALLDRSANRLLKMSNDVLDLAQIDAGRVELHPEACNIRELIEDIVASFDPVARQKDIAMRVDYAIRQEWLVADRTVLTSVLQNLVANAVKFTDAGHVVVAVDSFEFEAISIKISDTGIGIAVDRQKAIFDEFEQANPNIAGTYGGTGLGLAIVKRQVDLMRGDIEVKSAPGKGTTFRILLPMRRAAGEGFRAAV